MVKIETKFMLSKKRAFDLLSSISILVLIIPFGILSYPFLMFLIGKPIIFKQERIGKNGKKFKLYKLRSMKANAQSIKNKYLTKNEAPLPMFKMAEDPRFIKKEIIFFGIKKPKIVRVGKFLSSSGIDEIPQFLNILKGEMSLIGPRPLPVDEAEALEKIDKNWYKWRHEVRPGIFSVWAADSKHNKSLNYWKKLEKETLSLSFEKQILVIFKIIFKQIKNIFHILKERL
jgi:lipopolysaccharide/colanic/teichoic acid biosynthesis glycosyltransferase